MSMRTGIIVCLFIATTTHPLQAADPETIDLFGQRYRVQRFDYSQEITFPNPHEDDFLPDTVNLIESEAVAWLGNNRMLVTTSETASITYENFIVEVTVNTDVHGNVTGLEFLQPSPLLGGRHVVINDTFPAGFPLFGLAHPFDLDVSGVAVNPGSSGLAPGGLLVAEGKSQTIKGYVYDPTNPNIPADATDHASNFLGDFNLLDPAEFDIEDMVVVPGFAVPGEYGVDAQNPQPVDLLFALDQECDPPCGPSPSIEVFDLAGGYRGGFLIGANVNPDAVGDPKAVAYLPDGPTSPASFQGKGGVLIVVYDDEGPGIHAFDLLGNEIDLADPGDPFEPAYHPLTDDGTPFGNPILDKGTIVQQLQLEASTADPDTGRLYFFQEGSGLNDNYLWIMTPTNRAGCNGNDPVFDTHPAPLGDGDVDEDDFDQFITCFTGPAIPDVVPPEDPVNCLCFDLNNDGIIDMLDFARYQLCYSGEGVEADPACDD